MLPLPIAFFLAASATRVALTPGACVISNAQDLADLRRTEKHGLSFELTGQVIIPSYARDLPITVESEGKYLTFYDRRPPSAGKTRAGDIIRITGKAEPSKSKSSVNFNCYGLSVVTNKPLPKSSPVSIGQFLTGEFTDRRVAIRGTVKDILPDDIDARFVDLALTDGSDIAYVYYSGTLDSDTVIRSLQGAEVIATGIGRRKFGARKFSGPTLEISGTNAVQVLRKNHADVFDVPETRIRTCGNPQDLRAGLIRKTTGIVVAVWNNDSFLLHTDSGTAVQVETSERALPAIGDAVEVVGHLETDLIDLYLSRALWRSVPTARRPLPVRITDIPLRNLFTTVSSPQIKAASYQGEVFRIKGLVKNVGTDRNGSRRQMLLADDGYSILIDCTAAQSTLDSIGEGYRIEVTGVCIKDSELWRPSVAVPKIRSIFLVVRNDGDIRVLKTPPWWTPQRFVLALIFLFSIIVAILVWNATLRFMVTRKSRALLREQVAKLHETLRIGERTHLAAELHDYLAQNLTVVALQMTAAQAALCGQKNDIANYVDTAARMLKSCRTDLRRCLWDLRSDVLDEPNFTKAIEKTVRPIVGKAKLLIRFKGKRSDLSDSTAHAILSMLRELAANAVNHGNAQLIRIAGEFLNQGIRFSIADDGTGFDMNAIPNQGTGHFGLDGIRERLNRLGGTLSIDARPGRGTYVRLTIPSSFESSHSS